MASIPGLATHPDLVKFQSDRVTLAMFVAAARQRHRELVADRDALTGQALVPVALGQVTRAEVNARIGELDQQVEAAAAEVARLEMSLQQFDVDGRGIREQAM